MDTSFCQKSSIEYTRILKFAPLGVTLKCKITVFDCLFKAYYKDIEYTVMKKMLNCKLESSNYIG